MWRVLCFVLVSAVPASAQVDLLDLTWMPKERPEMGTVIIGGWGGESNAFPSSPAEIPIPRYFYYTWAGLSAGVHLSVKRDVSSTLAVRALCPSLAHCSERFGPARGLFASGDRAKFHAAAQLGALGVNAVSLLLLKKAPGPVKPLGFFLQGAVIIFTNVAANRNRGLERRLREAGDAYR